MADITMCSGEKCQLKENCYRYTAKPNEFRQAYFMEPPVLGETCEYFWRTDEPEKKSNNKLTKKDDNKSKT